MDKRTFAISAGSALGLTLTGSACFGGDGGEPIVGDWDLSPTTYSGSYASYTYDCTRTGSMYVVEADALLSGDIDVSVTCDWSDGTSYDYESSGTVIVTAGDERSYDIEITFPSSEGDDVTLDLQCALSDDGIDLACTGDSGEWDFEKVEI